MLVALNRRVPRTKSVFDRTSSRRYSCVDLDTNGYYDKQQERVVIENSHNGHSRQNTLNLIDSILRPNDDAGVPLNGHDDFTVLFDVDDEIDEYACFYFTNTTSFYLVQCIDFDFALIFKLIFIRKSNKNLS